MPQRPMVDMAACTLCEGCLDLAPQVFTLNQAGGYIEVTEMESYPPEVDEAMADCPADAISWEEMP